MKRILPNRNGFLYGCIAIALTGCGVVKDTSKHAFVNGYYTSRLIGSNRTKVYVANVNDSIYVYLLAANSHPITIDTSRSKQLSFPSASATMPDRNYRFLQTRFDIDLLTTPFKIRPAKQSLPTQFNTNLNGVVYLGYRSDLYMLQYERTPLSMYNRKITHYGFSIGGFTGFGGTDVSEHVTEQQVSAEYSGIVWTKGLAAILGVDNITIGLVAGWDNLLDNNRRFWIYQVKPWIGLAFGLNLN
jgi:hypothetical protein